MGKHRTHRATIDKRVKGHNPKTLNEQKQKPTSGTDPTERPSVPTQEWVRPPGLSKKFDILVRKTPGGLVIAQLNVNKTRGL